MPSAFVREADLDSETPLRGAPRSGRIVRRRPIMGQGGSKIPGGERRRPRPGAREAAAKLDEIDEDDLASLSDEDLDLLLAAEEDVAAEGPDDRATGADASSTAASDAGSAERSRADSSGEALGDGDDAEGGEGSGHLERANVSATPPRRKDVLSVRNRTDTSRSKRGGPAALRAAAAGHALKASTEAVLKVTSVVVKQSLVLVVASSAGALRRARARPARAARFVAGSLCGGLAKAVAHALLVASAECFAPTRVALKTVRVGAALVAGGAGLRAVSAEKDGVFQTAFSKPFRNRLLRFFSRAFDLVSPVPPDVARARLNACAPAFRALTSGAACCSTGYLKNALRFFFVSRAGYVVAPIKTRQISYATRVAPVVASYVARREWINVTTKPGTNERSEKWGKTHVWGAERIEAIVRVYGGFFTKIGQLMGTAQQMMPEAYVRAFSRTMDANPPAAFAFVRGEINRSLEASSVGAEDGGVSPYRDVFEATFLEFDETPAATASVAQVHFARLRSDGARVAVKVIVADKNVMLGDLACASATARVMSRLGLDSGVDFPTVFAAYSDVVEEEFDLAREAEKMREFATLFESRGLGDKIAVPEPRDFLCGESVLVSTRARGTKLLKTLNRARESGRRPKCPPAAAAVHAFNRSDPRCGGWDGVFHTMHLAWGTMLLRHGHFHCDPHPGNFILRADGKLAILDWGQTHSFAPPFRRHLCRLVVHMAGEHHEAIAAEVREHSQVKLERPTTEALSALCFAYFDTRATPLAECNLLDLSNSPFLKNKIVRNTREGFNVIRCVFLFRGMMAACGVEGSAVEVWESDARRALAEANEPVPSLLASRTRRAATRAWLTAQRALNVGAGARLNTLEAFVRSGNGHDVSTNANGAEDTRGSWRMGLSAASAPGTPRRMRSALW